MFQEHSIETQINQEFDCVVEEFESSIQIAILKSLYDRIRSKYNHVGEMSLVVHYPDGCRIAHHRCQRKVVVHKTNVLKIHVDKNKPAQQALFLCLTRKHSKEYPAPVPQNASMAPNLIITRTILYETQCKNYNIRIAIECHAPSNNKSGTYFLASEIEYDELYYNNSYVKLPRMESILIDKLLELYGDEIYSIDFSLNFCKISMPNMIHIPSRKFSNLTTYSKNDSEMYTYKYDGHKGKLVLDAGSNKGKFYDDLHNMCEVTYPSELEFLAGIILQVEIMRPYKLLEETTQTPSLELIEYCKYPTLFIVDIIGIYRGNTQRSNLFVPEPANVLELFEHLNFNCKRPFNLVQLGDLGTYKLLTQYPLRCQYTELNRYIEMQNREYTDGMLIIKGNRIYKHKIPTIDVRALKGYLYLDDSVGSICKGVYENLIEGAIYEVAPFNKKFAILRRRLDRVYTSTKEEFEQFKEDVDFKRKHAPPIQNKMLN